MTTRIVSINRHTPQNNNQEFLIEKNVPIPPRQDYRFKYPVRLLLKNESFFVKTTKPIQHIAALVPRWKKITRFNFTLRTIKKNRVQIGIRIWRIK